MNIAMIIGNLTKDPELRQTPTGLSACTFTVAVNRKPDKNGVKGVDYITAVCWRSLAENCAKFLTKGSKVCVEGEIRTRSYDGKDGHKVYVTELLANNVEFLTVKGSESKEPSGNSTFEELPDYDDQPLPF